MRHRGSGTSRSATELMRLGVRLDEEFSAVLSASAIGGFLWDCSSDLVHVDATGLAVFGLTPDAYDGRRTTLCGRMESGEIPVFHALVQEDTGERDGKGLYFRVRGTGSGTRWARMEGSVRRDFAGRATSVLGIVRDANADFGPVQQVVSDADRERQAAIVQASVSALSRVRTVRDVTEALTHEIAGTLGAVSVSLELVEQGKMRLFAAPRLLSPASLRELEFSRWDETRAEQLLPAHTAVRTREPLFLNREDVRTRYPRLWSHIRDSSMSGSAMLPLVVQTRPIGALGIHYGHQKTFTPEERNLLKALASAVAQSVQRAMLHDQNLAMAVALQQAMLPARTPEIPGARIAVRYQSATAGHQVGGDWYDVVPLPGDRAGVVIGDVQGHDIHASAVMGQLRTALRAYASEGHPPATVMGRASAFLRDLDPERFATCLYVELDPLTGHAQFIRAGHHGPLLRHADGSTSRPDIRGGLPLGLSRYDSAPYPTSHVRLRPEETLLMYTDGLIERRGSGLDEGVRRIEMILREGPADTDLLAESIMRSAETGWPQEDDIALVVVRFGRPASPAAAVDSPVV